MSNFPAGQQKRGPFRPLSRRHQGGRPPSRPHTRLPQAGVPLLPVQAALPLAETPERRPPPPVSKWQMTGSARGPHCEGGPSVGKRQSNPGEGPQKDALPLPVPPFLPAVGGGRPAQRCAHLPGKRPSAGNISPTDGVRRGAERIRPPSPSGHQTRPGFLSEEPLQSAAAPLSRTLPQASSLNGAPPLPVANSSPRQTKRLLRENSPQKGRGAAPQKPSLPF